MSISVVLKVKKGVSLFQKILSVSVQLLCASKTPFSVSRCVVQIRGSVKTFSYQGHMQTVVMGSRTKGNAVLLPSVTFLPLFYKAWQRRGPKGKFFSHSNLWLKQDRTKPHKRVFFTLLFTLGFPLTPLSGWSWFDPGKVSYAWKTLDAESKDFPPSAPKYMVGFWLGCSPVIYNSFNWLSLLWNIRKNPQGRWSAYSVYFNYVIVSLLKSFWILWIDSKVYTYPGN